MKIFVINAIPMARAAEKGHVTYPDDFPMLAKHGGDFYAWEEFFDPRTHVETTLEGEALKQALALIPDIPYEEGKKLNAQSASVARRLACQMWGGGRLPAEAGSGHLDFQHAQPRRHRRRYLSAA